MNLRQLLPHLSVFGANLIYAVNYTVAKDVMPEFIQPFGFVVLRVSGALLLFWLCQSLFPREAIRKQDWGRLFLCAVFGVATNQLLFLYGLSMTSPINAAIIMTSNPILVLIAAAIMLKERISWRRIGGIGLGMAGAITLIVMNQGEGLSSGNAFGDLMILINATSYGVYLVLVKPLMGRYHPLTVMKWIFTFGLFLVVPFGLEQFLAVEWGTLPGIIWGEAAFVVVGTTFLAYLFNIFGLKHLSPATVSAYIYLQPVLAAMVALMLGRDLLDPVKIIAAVLIFTGVYLVSKK